MTSANGPAEIANRHWYGSYAAFVEDLGGEFRRFGTVGAFLGGVPHAFANGCLVLEPAEPADLDEAIRWVLTGDVPFAVRVEESLVPSVAQVIDGQGLERDPEPMPGMLLKPIPRVPAPAPGVTVARVDVASYPDYVATLIATGLPEAWAERTFSAALIDDPECGYFLARLDGVPVGTALAMRTGDIGGIYTVGTVAAARRRGVGTAVTWAAVEQIRAWGCDAAVLQASAMGYPVYLSMGFEEVVQYARFRPPTAAPPEPQATQ